MSSSLLRPCLTCQSDSETRTQDFSPPKVELLTRCRVRFKPDTPLKEPLTPSDLLSLVFTQYIPWAVFFDDDVDFQGLVEALHFVASKYLLLSGRLSTDSEGRYVIEVSVPVSKYSIKYFVKVGSNEGTKYDFPVTEMKAEMQMAEAILSHGQTTTKSADFPVHPEQLPFYLEYLNLEAIHKYAILHCFSKPQFCFRGQDPFLSVKLTHFSDGCCLAISICHFLIDGLRLVELYRDIARAYRGIEVSVREINRQYMLFQRFSQYFSPEVKDGCIIPKTTITGREPLTLKQYPNESVSLEVLYVSNQVIEDMKSGVEAFIPKGSFVSTADLMQALLWMLQCELRADSGEITDSTDLEIAGTSSMYMVELSSNCPGIIPSNYLGNALLAPLLIAEDEVKTKSLLELLASLALLTRTKQIALKEQPKEVFKLLIGNCDTCDSIPESFRAAVSNYCKLPLSEVDFGQGAPALMLCNTLLPCVGIGWYISPVLQTGGILLHSVLTTRQKKRLKKSSVLKECAPGVKSLFDDFKVSEFSKLLRPQ